MPTDRTNLVWRAAEMLAVEGGVAPNVEIVIEKGIPVAGGMAGGSADAAAALVALNALWKLDFSRPDLDAFAARLGSDVPFSLHGGTALGTGRGEQLVPVLTRHTFHWVLALAKGGLSTPVVFRELDKLRAEGSPKRVGSADALIQALTTGDAHSACAAARQRSAGCGTLTQPGSTTDASSGRRSRSFGRHRLRLRTDMRLSLRRRTVRGGSERRTCGSGGVPHRSRGERTRSRSTNTRQCGKGTALMANLINLENVSKSFGVKPLLDGVSLGVEEGERIGVVGLNGGGKTTMLEVLAGVEQPDSGRVSRVGGLRMAVVTQRGVLPPGSTVGEVVLGPLGVAQHEWAGDARIRSVLSGIGIDNLGAGGERSALDAKVDGLSGGERRRVALAAALVQDLDLLVLDEPTNHLDVEGVQWLAEHLVSRRSALVVVTHDRWFLDTVATRTWEVVGGGVESYEGGYNDWVFARAERSRQADASEERRRNLARKELAWLRRGAPARTSKPKYRIEAAEALIADVPAPRDAVALASFAQRRLGKVVIELEDARLETPDGRVLVEDLTWRLAPGERVGLVGVNGSGKTTLLRTLAGELEPAAGKRIQGQTVHIGWLKQELDDLPTDMRVLDAVKDVAERITLGDKEVSAGQLAERLGFTPARQRTPVGDLSGGERRRLQLTRVLMAEPNVLLLDEPTNDLDIDTLQQLEDLLDGWAGTMVVISHDRYLIERICDTTWALFGDRKLTNLPGGIEDYLRRRAAMGDGDNPSVASTASGASKSKQVRDGAADRAARKELSKLERSIAKFDDREKKLHASLADAATDPDKLQKLGAELKQVIADKEAAEEQWMELFAELDG